MNAATIAGLIILGLALLAGMAEVLSGRFSSKHDEHALLIMLSVGFGVVGGIMTIVGVTT